MGITDRSKSLYSSLLVAKKQLERARYALQRVQIYNHKDEGLSSENPNIRKKFRDLDKTVDILVNQIRPAIIEIENRILDIDLLNR